MLELRFLRLPMIAVVALLVAACNDSGQTATNAPTTPATTANADADPVDAAPVDADPAGDANDGIDEGPISPDADTDDIFRLADARRLLDEMIATYSQAPALKDYVVQASWLVNQEQPLREYQFFGGPGKNMHLVDPDSEFMWLDGNVYATARVWPDRYLRVRGKEDLFNHTQNEFGGFFSPLKLHMALRLGRSHQEVLDGLDLDSPDPSKISSYRRRTDKQGRDREVLSIISGSGSARYFIDPETKLIMEAEVEYAPSDAPEGIMITKHLTFHPEILDELPEPITFVPADRTRVVTIANLLGRGD